jgi:chitodextrinase
VVQPARTVNHRFEVGSGRLDVTSRWADGDVVLSLTSPSGRVIDRDTVAADVTHEVGPTFETYHVKSPEHGVWTATLYGAQVAPEGEEARLDIYQAPVANTPPTARIQQSFDGRTVAADGSNSSDPDGSIVTYLWEFGDGATAHGPTATHTYTEPGTYLVTLAVQDDQGRWSVNSAPSVVEVT